MILVLGAPSGFFDAILYNYIIKDLDASCRPLRCHDPGPSLREAKMGPGGHASR